MYPLDHIHHHVSVGSSPSCIRWIIHQSVPVDPHFFDAIFANGTAAGMVMMEQVYSPHTHYTFTRSLHTHYTLITHSLHTGHDGLAMAEQDYLW
jgi:hypothetical protein